MFGIKLHRLIDNFENLPPWTMKLLKRNSLTSISIVIVGKNAMDISIITKVIFKNYFKKPEKLTVKMKCTYFPCNCLIKSPKIIGHMDISIITKVIFKNYLKNHKKWNFLNNSSLYFFGKRSYESKYYIPK